jgi:hypothetical protein
MKRKENGKGMKKIAALMIISALFITALPVFADTVCGMSREEYRKKSLYDKIMDPIKNFKVAEKDKIKPLCGDKVKQESGKDTK